MQTGATLAQVKAAIQAKGYGTDTDTAQTELVNAVYRRVLSSRRWTFLEAQTTLPTVTGTKSVTLSPADMLHINSVRMEIGTEYPTIEWMPIEQLRDLSHEDRQPGQPRYWSKWNGTLELWPVPDRAYTLDINYTMHPASLASGSDALVIPRGYEDVVVWGAIIDMAFRQRDWSAANVAKQEHRERLDEMANMYGNTQSQTSREVESWDGWAAAGYYV